MEYEKLWAGIGEDQRRQALVFHGRDPRWERKQRPISTSSEYVMDLWRSTERDGATIVQLDTQTAAHLVCILRRSIRFTLPSSLSRAPNRRFSGSFLSLRRPRKAIVPTHIHMASARAYGTGMVESTTWPLLGPGTKEKGAREPKHDNGPANNYHYITSTEGESTVATGFVNNPSPSLVFWRRRASRGRKQQVGRHYRHHHHHHLRRLQSSKWYKHEKST